MTANLFELFKLSKTIKMQDGEILLMSSPVNLIPTDILVDLQKDLIESLGFRKTYDQIYKSSKIGALTYNKDFVKHHDFDDKRKIVDWQWKIVTLAGWGNWEITSIDSANNRLVAKFENAPFPKQYGKANYPVCFTAAGFSAGGISTAFNADLDCVETKCVAMGDPFCQIEVGPKKEIEEKRKKLWNEWGVE